MEKEKLYVVVAVQYSYNDEISYTDNDSAGVPVKAYKSREKAEAEMKYLTDKFWRDNKPRHFAYGNLQDMFGDIAAPFVELNPDIRFEDLSEEEQQMLLDDFSVQPFYVSEMEVE